MYRTFANIFFSFSISYKKESVWLKENDKIKGFEWRGGTERVTSGILIWSKPFICQDKFGEKVILSYEYNA